MRFAFILSFFYTVVTMSKKFQRKIEDFTCDHCGFHIEGNGYTNHCPDCLWSKHVDVNPGDRLHACQGMMRPVHVETKDGSYIITHQCQKCGAEKRNKIAPNDDFEQLSKINLQV
jgi:hypothetical protein